MDISSLLFLLILVDALRCNQCHFDTSQNGTVCTAIIQNCSESESFCSTIMDERYDGSKTFARSCVPKEVCEPDYCDTFYIQSLRRKSCNITCCREDLCNRDDYVPPVNSGHVLHVHWCLGYTFLLAVAWVSLSRGY